MAEIIQWNLKRITNLKNVNYQKKVDIIKSCLSKVQNTMVLNIQETHITCIEEMPNEWMLFDNVYTIFSSFATMMIDIVALRYL